jgi:DNA-binding transcriptional LysR family regulator
MHDPANQRWRRASTATLDQRLSRMELRRLHYFVTLAEELHFGRAVAREHIVQSALSRRLQRLERELGVTLVERTTHHVRLTAAGAAFLVDARQILAHVERATVERPSLRVGVVDASYDSMSLVLREVQQQYSDLGIHQVEVGVPEQFQRLVDGLLDIGIGRASLAPPTVAPELFGLDPLGVLVAEGHAFAARYDVPVATLAAEPLLLSEEVRAPEFNQFVIELCRSVGSSRPCTRGTVDSILASADLVAQQLCVLCAPSSCVPTRQGSGGGPGAPGALHGRCCVGPATPQNMSAPLSTRPARCRSSSAGCSPRRRADPDPARVIGVRDEPCSHPPFPRATRRGFLTRGTQPQRQDPASRRADRLRGTRAPSTGGCCGVR